MWESGVVVKGDVLAIVTALVPPPAYPYNFWSVFEKCSGIGGYMEIVGVFECESWRMVPKKCGR